MLQELFSGVELAVLAGVMERNVGIRAPFSEIDFATVERFRVDVNADGALLELGQIQHLMDRLEGIDIGGMSGVHFVDVRGDDFAFATRSIFFLYAEVLDLQPADGSRHPAVLIAMIVNAAGLADFPADGHALEDFVFEDEISRVIALGEKEILFQSFGADGVAEDIVLNVLQGEVAPSNFRKAFDPVCDC